MRKIIALSVAAVAAVAFTLAIGGGEAEASKKKKASAPKAKLCSATSIEGKKVSFRCKANESCCYDGLMAKGNCVPVGQVCF